MGPDGFWIAIPFAGSDLLCRHEKTQGDGPLSLVPFCRYLDVLLLPGLCRFTGQKTETVLELIETYFDAFTEQQLSQLRALKGLYEKWNARINVISRKDMDHFYEHHVLHSLAIAACFECTPGMQVLDLGCGGGFPGIPLAIFFPETEFLLPDSITKKLTVVKEVSAAIGLTK